MGLGISWPFMKKDLQQMFDDQTDQLRLPILTRYQQAVEEGKAYRCRLYFSLASGSTATFAIVAGTKRAHVTMVISTTDQAEVSFLFNPTVSGGTEADVFPLNHSSTIQNTLRIIVGPTVSGGQDEGTEVIPGGSKKYAVGSTYDGLVGEWFNPSEVLAITLKNTSGNANKISARLTWWEEP